MTAYDVGIAVVAGEALVRAAGAAARAYARHRRRWTIVAVRAEDDMDPIVTLGSGALYRWVYGRKNDRPEWRAYPGAEPCGWWLSRRLGASWELRKAWKEAIGDRRRAWEAEGPL